MNYLLNRVLPPIGFIYTLIAWGTNWLDGLYQFLIDQGQPGVAVGYSMLGIVAFCVGMFGLYVETHHYSPKSCMESGKQ